MNQFTQILETAASQLNLPFSVCQSSKSEAAYLLIANDSYANLNNIYSCVSVRLASHDASTEKSMAYEIQLDNGFNFDYSCNDFRTTWGIDEDGDFSTEALEDEMIFSNDEEMIFYMANCLVLKLKDKI